MSDLDRMLDLLACPVTGSRLRREGEFLVSEEGRRYPIEDGIPALRSDRAILPDDVT